MELHNIKFKFGNKVHYATPNSVGWWTLCQRGDTIIEKVREEVTCKPCLRQYSRYYAPKASV